LYYFEKILWLLSPLLRMLLLIPFSRIRQVHLNPSTVW
jgi:hypothetical protein